MKYTITFFKDMLGKTFNEDLEYKIYTTTDKKFALEKAEELNRCETVNIQVEHFRVWESITGKFSKKSARQIYPSREKPLFS